MNLLDFTSRQCEVIKLLAAWNDNKSVALALGISKKTAEKHRAHIYERGGFRNAVDVTLFAFRNGLFPEPLVCPKCGHDLMEVQ